MSFETRRPYQSENHFDKDAEKNLTEFAVLVDGKYLGYQVPVFEPDGLSSLGNSRLLGRDAYREVFFETISGNLYHVYELDSENLVFVSARENRGNRGNPKGTIIPCNKLRQAALQVGRKFELSSDHFSTTPLKTIIAITGKQFATGTPDEKTIREIAERETDGKISDIRRRFEQQIGD